MYENKITSARQIIETHNENISKETFLLKVQKIIFEDFLQKIQDMGGTTEEALKQCSWEDLEKCGLPRLVARQIAKIFRQSDNTIKSSYISKTRAEMLSPKDLLEKYNPHDAENSVGKRLKALSRGKKCIVFGSNGKVNVEVSEKLIKDYAIGYGQLDQVLVEGKPCLTCKIGEVFDVFAEENPIYPGRVLRPGGICDQTNRSWEGVSLEIRQFVLLAIKKTSELHVSNLDDAHNILDKVLVENALDNLRKRYTKTSIMFDELEKLRKLPTLKIKLNGLRKLEKFNDPFSSNTTY